MAQELNLGPETLKDIIADLLKPGRDFRDSFDAPVLRQDVLDIKDLATFRDTQETSGLLKSFSTHTMNFLDLGA